MLNPEHVKKTVAALKEKFPETVQEVSEFRGETTVNVAKAAIAEVCRFLRDDAALDYNVLTDLAAVDYSPEEPRFGVSYILFSMSKMARLRLKVLVPEEDPEVPTVTNIYINADWYEREAWDMMGIKFAGHPDLRRLLMPADWEGHPHRKDYPLGYEEVQFSFNWREIDAKKPYAKE